MATIPLGDHSSVIIFHSPPDRMNAMRMFYLLHEMGHIGRLNRLSNATTLRPWFKIVANVAMAITLSDGGDVVWRLTVVVVTFLSTLLSDSGSRLEAEIVADHFSLRATIDLMFLDIPGFWTILDRAGPLFQPEVTPPDDMLMGDPAARQVRRMVFEELRTFALEGRYPELVGLLSTARNFYLDNTEARGLVALAIVLVCIAPWGASAVTVGAPAAAILVVESVILIALIAARSFLELFLRRSVKRSPTLVDLEHE